MPNRTVTENQYLGEFYPGKYGFTNNWTTPLDGQAFSDPDGDTLTFSWASQNDAVVRGWFRFEDGIRKISTMIRHPVVDWVTGTLTVSDGYGATVYWNIHYKASRNETWYVDENSGARTILGRLFSRNARNPQADAGTLSLRGFPDGLFTIDADRTGQVRVAQGAVLDFETTSSYSGSIAYKAGGANAVVYVTIYVRDREAGKPGTPTVTRTQFSEQSNPALDVTWTAAAANGTAITGYEVQYRVKVAQGETANAWTDYTVAGSDGNPTRTLPASTRSINLPDLTAGTTYEAQVRALTKLEGEGPWSDIGEGRANRPPEYAVHNGVVYFIVGDGGLPVGETYVSRPVELYFADPDGDTLRWDVSSQHPGIGDVGEPASRERPESYPFLPDEMTPRWTFNIYNPASLDVTYGAHDGYGGYVSRTLSSFGTQAETRTIAENSSEGTTVGNPVTGTPYDDGDDQTDDALTYTLTGDAAAAFVIDAASGQISVKQGASLDFETTSSYTGSVTWTVQGQTATANLTINVTDVEAGKPDAPTVTRTEFSEQSHPALDVTWTAPDANGLTISWYRLQYRKQAAAGEDPVDWTLHSSILVTNSLRLSDLEAGAVYEFQVRAGTNEEGLGPWSDTGSGRANRAPTATSTAFNGGTFPVGSIATYAETGQGALGPFFGDADGDTLTYSASAQHAALLGVSLSGAAGSATLTATLLNPGASTITFTASDPYGGQVTRTTTITGSPRTVSRSVAENSAAGTAVGDPVTGTPYDDGDEETDDALSYTLAGAAATSGNFEIDSATGQISVKQGASLDYETETSYSGTVNYTVDGHAAVINVNISVLDLEAGKPKTPTVTRTEFSEQSNPALDVTWTAPEANGLTITGYNAQYRKQVADGETANAWTDYTIEGPDEQQTSTLPATTTSMTLPDLEAGAVYEFQVRALTSEEGEGPWSDTGSGRANQPPHYAVWNNQVYFYVNGPGPGLPVGDTTWVSGPIGLYYADPDGDALRWDVSSQYPGIGDVGESRWEERPSEFPFLPDERTLRWTFEFYNPASLVLTYGAHDGYGG